MGGGHVEYAASHLSAVLDDDSAPQVLQGVRVVELGQGVSASYCAKLLADCGADVVKVEPLAGDWHRRTPPVVGEDGTAATGASFLACNANKRSVALDVGDPRGQSLLRQLCDRADIVVENEGSRAWSGPAATQDVWSRNPRLVVTTITPFGSASPYGDWAATDIVIQAMGGWIYGLGEPDREPLRPPGNQSQVIGGLCGFLGTLTALHSVRASGVGDHVDVSIVDAVTWFLQNPVTVFNYSGAIWTRRGGSNPTNYPQNIMPCKDGFVGVNVIYHAEWGRFCDLVGRPEWEHDPRLRTPLERRENYRLMEPDIFAWLSEQTADEVYHAAQEKRVPFARVNSPADLLASDHLAARNYWVHQHPAAGSLVQPGAAFTMSRTPLRSYRPAPGLGEHTNDVLAELLGFDPTGISELREAGVVR